jgi:hypothetical protein
MATPRGAFLGKCLLVTIACIHTLPARHVIMARPRIASWRSASISTITAALKKLGAWLIALDAIDGAHLASGYSRASRRVVLRTLRQALLTLRLSAHGGQTVETAIGVALEGSGGVAHGGEPRPALDDASVFEKQTMAGLGVYA